MYIFSFCEISVKVIKVCFCLLLRPSSAYVAFVPKRAISVFHRVWYTEEKMPDINKTKIKNNDYIG